MDPPKFQGGKSEDAHEFETTCRELLEVVGLSESHGVRYATLQLRRSARDWWRTYSGCSQVGSPPVTWEQFASAFQDHFVPWSMREETRLSFESLRQDGLSVTESAVFRTSREGTSFQSIVSTAKEEELIEREEFGDPKRARISGQFQGTPSGGRGSQRVSGSFQQWGPIHASMPIFQAGQTSRGSYESVLGSYSSQRRPTRRGNYSGFSGSTQQFPAMPGVSKVEWKSVSGSYPSKEFLDVFPSYLPGVPPDRDINFAIDLEPGTKPISISPYHMAQEELKELKDQLKDLLSKGFIRPSWSNECEESFQKLKTFLSSAPVLTLPEEGVDFSVYYDASGVGLGGVLMQKGKANVVADTLSRKTHSIGSLASLSVEEKPLARDVQLLANSLVRLQISEENSWKIEQIHAHKFDDEKLCLIRDKVLGGEAKEVVLDSDGVLRIGGRICVPKTDDLIRLILEKAHFSRYSIHPGAAKMYHDLSQHYWWCGMKRDITDFVLRCLTCQQVKCEHQRPGGVSQRMPIPTWKWERITMDFDVGLPTTVGGYDSIRVVVDRLTKSSHFILVRVKYTAEKLAELYISQIMRLHGVPISIISDRGSLFTSHFWKALQHGLGTQLDMSTAFHPQTDGQSERTIKVLEDMLRDCAIDFGARWDQYLPLAEFAYNNSYHSSIQMAPFEALYGRRCRSPIGWFDSAEIDSLDTDLLRDAIEQVRMIQFRLLTAQSRQ
ncbi:uncharacterized protein [Solanum lycopersicum]|uniref:uncharacterized protein n=1 Tax=Solanum lycopersicum TaxID=4081 RepID=UPI003747C1D7